MSDLVHDSDIGRRRRERALAAVERIEGVVAATVDLGPGSRIDAVRLVLAPGASAESIRTRALDLLRGLGYETEAEAVHTLRVASGVVAPTGQSPPSVRPADRPAEGRSPAADDHGVAADVPGVMAGASPEVPPEEVVTSQEPTAIEDQGPPPPWHGRFLVLDGVDVHRRDARVVCTVRLKRLGELFSAEVQELDTPQGRARAAARAALQAAEKSGEGVGLSLEGVVVQEFFGRRYVMVFVDGIAHRRHAPLCGILNVEQSLETTAALAVLRAVERWVAW